MPIGAPPQLGAARASMMSIKGMEGDFPGVTSLINQKADLKNCLDPNLILKIRL